ncbi:hypothetical protein OY671_007750, partial [Metschnikowia pulcherrima]
SENSPYPDCVKYHAENNSTIFAVTNDDGEVVAVHEVFSSSDAREVGRRTTGLPEEGFVRFRGVGPATIVKDEPEEGMRLWADTGREVWAVNRVRSIVPSTSSDRTTAIVTRAPALVTSRTSTPRPSAAMEITVSNVVMRSIHGIAMFGTSPKERRDVLDHCVGRFRERFDESSYASCVEAGKPIADAEGEVGRSIDTFRIAAEEATRNYGEIQPLDISPRSKGYMGMWKRVPIGPCSFISPFNFPSNSAAHKIAPAIAVGCPFVMKSASMTPSGAIIIGEVSAECDVSPEGAFSISPASRAGSDSFTTDERSKSSSFTGSPGVGWDSKARAGKKKVVLESGGNAAVVVDKDADLDHASARIIFGGYYQSGQSCIHVQRVIIHADIYDTFR